MKEKHKRDDCKVCGRSIEGGKAACIVPWWESRRLTWKEAGLMTEMCFFKAVERDLSAIGSSEEYYPSLPPSLISLCSTCHATNNNLVKRTAGIPTRVWPVSILEERFLGDWKIVRKRVDSDGFESGWREDIQMSSSRRSCGILCRNGWIIISGYRCKMINLEKVLKVEESRKVASFSGRIWFY